MFKLLDDVRFGPMELVLPIVVSADEAGRLGTILILVIPLYIELVTFVVGEGAICGNDVIVDTTVKLLFMVLSVIDICVECGKLVVDVILVPLTLLLD